MEERLTDRELDELLREWNAPAPSAALRSRLFGPRLPWWRRVWTMSIRVPVPVAAGLALIAGLGAWEWRVHPHAGVPVRTAAGAVPELRPVTELRPRIIRSQNAKN